MSQGGLILAAGRVRSKKTKPKSNPHEIRRRTQNSKHTAKNHSSPATVSTSKRHAPKYLTRVSPSSPASVDTQLHGNQPRTALAIGNTKTRQRCRHTAVVHSRRTNYLDDREPVRTPIGKRRFHCRQKKTGLATTSHRQGLPTKDPDCTPTRVEGWP